MDRREDMAGRVAARVAIIGAGYAGLSAAVELADAGLRPEIFEVSRTLGGRARALEIEGITVDNGAHILVGAYRETLRLMRKVSADRTALRRHPLHLEVPGKFRLHAPRLPAPLHLACALLAARGLSWPEKLAAIRFMRRLEKRRFLLDADMTVADLLAAHRQPARVSRHLWEPLCLAALNTPVEQASAQVFLNVLKDSLAADRSASDLLLPATDLSALFPEPAARFVEARGGKVHRGARIEAVTRRDGRFFLDDRGPYDQVILAVAPHHLPKLIAVLPELAPLARQVEALKPEPILTCYLAYADTVRLPFAMVGVAGGCAQWLFDFGALRDHCGGLIAAVISAHGPHEALDHDALAGRIHAEIAAIVPGLPPPRWHRIITEKRATFSCTPGLERPPTATALPGLWLAGDTVAGDYPATLEGAVRSGIAAARALIMGRIWP